MQETINEIRIKKCEIIGTHFNAPLEQKARIKFELKDAEEIDSTVFIVYVTAKIIWDDLTLMNFEATGTMISEKIKVKPPFRELKRISKELIFQINNQWKVIILGTPDIRVEYIPKIEPQETAFEFLRKIISEYTL